MLLKFVFLVVLIFAIMQTPFFNNTIVPQYTKFEAYITYLLTSEPAKIPPKRVYYP